MKSLFKKLACLLLAVSGTALADNQTSDLSPISPGSGLPFTVQISLANFQLPKGIQGGLFATYDGLWILIAGRTDGMHGFQNIGSFPIAGQNTSIYVINPFTGSVTSRSLNDPSSGLSQAQIDSLTVTGPEGFQENNTLYMAGGYGIDASNGQINTKPLLTAINLPGIVAWVMQAGGSVAGNITQISNATFQIAGGKMFKLGNTMQLIFGQNFSIPFTASSNGIYSNQIRQFQIVNNGNQLTVNNYSATPQDVNFRRHDLNVVPALLNNNNQLQYGLIAYSGVFTTTAGAWTVPVVINSAGNPVMADPNAPTTFKQSMNNYACATASLYSRRHQSMFHIFFGGISYRFFSNGAFQEDSELPFINNVTTVQMDKNGNFTQYLMDNQYPTILSTQSNPGNPLLFGASAYFIPANILLFNNSVISLDTIRKPTVIGYIVGGIASTVANTSVQTDSFASPYVFQVTLVPK